MSAKHWYRGYGLLFRSELDLPELAPTDPQPDGPDIEIRLGTDAGAALERPEAGGKVTMGFHATADGHVLCVDTVGKFLVRDGREIVVQLQDDADPGLVRLFLIGSALGMLFHQRGQLVLHGAAILRPGGLSIFVGESGAGKSTLAANLGRMGHPVLADDTLPLFERGDGTFQAWPGSRMFKLWRTSLDGMGEETTHLEAIGNRHEKFYYANPAQAPDKPELLEEIIVLDQSDDPGAPVRLSAMSRLEGLRVINDNAYRPEYVHHLGRETAHFRLTAALSGAAQVLRLTRPWSLGRMQDVIERLQDHWQGAPLDECDPDPNGSH